MKLELIKSSKNILQLLLLLALTSLFFSSASYSENISLPHLSEAKKSCGDLNALQAYQCFKTKFSDLERASEHILNTAIAQISKKYSDQVSQVEIKNRLLETQKSWKKYRDLQCQSAYVTSSSAHPPSQSLSIILCNFEMTEKRNIEIENTFITEILLNDLPLDSKLHEEKR